MVPSQVIGILSALASAVVWGGGDFAGGVASRRNAPTFVLMLASLAGLLVFIPASLLRNETLPSSVGILWSSLAGLCGGLGLAIFYRALSMGPASLVAPTAAVVGAAVPVVVGFVLEGPPATMQLVGLQLGLLGIWLVSSGTNERASTSSKPLLLALMAGVAFGGFFVFMAQVDRGSIFIPLVVARVTALALSAVLFAGRKRSLPPQTLSLLPFIVGVLNAGGNLLYLLAIQYIRLDIAAVISSMYPGPTVFLARTIQHEQMSRLQSVGIALCLVAVGCVALA